MKKIINLVCCILLLTLLISTAVACGSREIPGPQGERGPQGEQGIAGIDGKDGIDGANGKDGENGKSAYELAVENGFTGSVDEWLDSLVGEDGSNGAQGMKGDKGEKGDKGDKGDTGEKGEQGDCGSVGEKGEAGVGVEDVKIELYDNGYLFTFEFTDGSVKLVPATAPFSLETTASTVNNGVEDIDVYVTQKDAHIICEDNGSFTAALPQGVYLDNGSATAALDVEELDDDSAEMGIFAVDIGAEKTVFSIKIDEVNENNDTPIIINIGEDIVPAGLESISLFHSGEIMVSVASLSEVDAHNEFFYDFENGDITLATKNFSNFTIVNADAYILVDTAEELTDALLSGVEVRMENDIEMEAATTAPYGNKYGIALNGGILNGNDNELWVECYGDDYGIMTSGGTVKNLTIEEGCRAVMIMYAKEDVILDNVKIGGDGVLYPINTGEYPIAEGVDLIVTNSVIAGWTSYAGIESATFTNVEFKQGTYYNNIYGRVLKPYVDTTLTNCRFVEHMNLDLSGLAEGEKVIIENCTVNGVPVTADVFTVPETDEEYDTELFTVDLPSWATDLNDCIIFK